MIYCTLGNTPSDTPHMITASSSMHAWEDNQGRFSHFYSHCDVGVCQRLFWPEAVCFQDIKTSAGGILFHYEQYGLSVSLFYTKIQEIVYLVADISVFSNK